MKRTFSSSVQLVWSVTDFSSSSRQWVSGSVRRFEAHPVSSLPSRHPACSDRPTHHSPSRPSQDRDGPTAKPRGSNVERNEARTDGTGGERPAITLYGQIKSWFTRGNVAFNSYCDAPTSLLHEWLTFLFVMIINELIFTSAMSSLFLHFLSYVTRLMLDVLFCCALVSMAYEEIHFFYKRGERKLFFRGHKP